MPIVKIDMWKMHDQNTKKELIAKITDAVVESINCPPSAVHVIITETSKEDWGIGGKPSSELN